MRYLAYLFAVAATVWQIVLVWLGHPLSRVDTTIWLGSLLVWIIMHKAEARDGQ
jgi:hypothetical protein